MQLLRAGDTLKVTRLDRLGRSLHHLVNLGAQLHDRGIGLHVIEQGIDTTTAEGRAMFGMLSVLAEYQRELIVANTRDGLAAARSKTVAQIALMFGVARTTVYGHLNAAGSRAPAADSV